MSIATLPSLHEHLQSAIEVEHTQIPVYLCALYSIKDGHNREAARIIESVFVEEMLHMLLLANILNAVGGSPRLDHPGMLARYPRFLPHSNDAFQVPLAPFSRELIEIFMRIERPEDNAAAPQDERFETLGQFYEALVQGLKNLCVQLGEDRVFSGDRSRQITDEYFYGGSGRIITVTDLASALAAFEEIKEQGEGLNHSAIWDGDRNMFHPERGEVAHYFRFHQIVAGRLYQAGDTAQTGPTGEALAVDWDAVYPMRPNPCAADYPEGSPIRAKLDDFNRTYAGILHLLEHGLNGKPKLLAVATGAMYELKQQAIALMQLPSGDGKTTVGPSFEYIAPPQRHVTAHIKRKIVIWPNGPYVVYGDIPLLRKYRVLHEHQEGLTWRKGEPYETEETYALCRCGQSSTKPFCDGTHVRMRFDGTETADPRPSAQRRITLGGTGLVIQRDPPLCMGAHFCANHDEHIKQLAAATDDTQIRLMVIKMIENCPSGSFVYALEPGGPDMEPDLPQAIAVVDEGPHAGCLWVTGNIPIERADGKPFETRNRVTLCRCGQSKNKPLCDGTHRRIGFKD
jgi:CDGSH-type Zn-finger protein/rubrerythrin